MSGAHFSFGYELLSHFVGVSTEVDVEVELRVRLSERIVILIGTSDGTCSFP